MVVDNETVSLFDPFAKTASRENRDADDSQAKYPSRKLTKL